jgi:hypothetical protein
MKEFLLIIGIYYCLNNINAHYTKPHKFTIKELDDAEIAWINLFRGSRKDFYYNNELMTAAKNEALRLAQQGVLTPPRMDLFGNKHFYGFSLIYTDLKSGKDLNYFELLFPVSLYIYKNRSNERSSSNML